MDEPFASLDALNSGVLRNELVRIWLKTRKTIVFVTHNIEEAVLLSDRVAVMTARPGRIRAIIDVDLPKPRDVNSPEFNAIERQVRSLIFDNEAIAA
jgi:NitT/TauT family transport system ATP-binding protein